MAPPFLQHIHTLLRLTKSKNDDAVVNWEKRQFCLCYSCARVEREREETENVRFFCQSFLIQPEKRKKKNALSYYFTFFWLNEKYYEQENCSVFSSFTLKPFDFFIYFFHSPCFWFAFFLPFFFFFFFFLPSSYSLNLGFFSLLFVVSFNYYYYSRCMLMLRTAFGYMPSGTVQFDFRSLCNTVRMVSVIHFQSPFEAFNTVT